MNYYLILLIVRPLKPYNITVVLVVKPLDSIMIMKSASKLRRGSYRTPAGPLLKKILLKWLGGSTVHFLASRLDFLKNKEGI